DLENPDVYVTARRSFKTTYEVYSPYGYGYGWGWGWGYGAYGGPWYTEEIIKGTLVVDLIDAHSGALLWRGLGEREVHPMKSAEDRNERIYKEVTKIFKKFPLMGAVSTSGHQVPKPEH